MLKNRAMLSAERVVLSNIIQRCTNPKNDNYRYYGGRGIRVCDRWRESVRDFVEDMGLRPSPRHQIDRIDNNGDYRPGNCRWVLQTQNLRNFRRNRIVEYQGKRLCLVEFAEMIGLSYPTIRYRLENGWSVDDIASFGIREKRPTHCPRGHEYTDENTYTSSDGKRFCRSCQRARYHAKKERDRLNAI